MSTASIKLLEPASPLPEIKDGLEKTRGFLALSSFLFVLLQSVCTFFTALDGLRLIVGVGALTSITQAGIVWDHFHSNWIRIPMVAFALAGSLLNLAILRRIRRLRNRPASQWRQKPLTPRKIRMERIQIILSWATLAFIAVEELTHFHTFHKL
jgi:fumarate reductase subunit C